MISIDYIISFVIGFVCCGLFSFYFFRNTQKSHQRLINQVYPDLVNKINEINKTEISTTINPVVDKFDEFKKKIEDFYYNEGKERAGIKKEMEIMNSMSSQLSKDTKSLTDAFSGNYKAQGCWGEEVLENILEKSGMSDNWDYIKEGKSLSLVDENGKKQRPDVLVRLPGNGFIVVDSKVSLNAYLDIINGGDKESVAVEKLIKDIETHIKQLSGKKYHYNTKLNTPEYTLMFVPVESILGLVIKKKPEIIDNSWNAGIILVSPITLFSTLRLISSMWRSEKQKNNIAEIASLGGKVHDSICRYLEHFSQIGKDISKLNVSYENADKKLHIGNTSIIKQAQKLEELGAKTKKELKEENIKKVS